jgi:glutathione S-transferase
MYHGKHSLASNGRSRYAQDMKLYRFRHSPYARKVQMLLDLLGRPYEPVEVAYTDRSELARVTGGYIYVPVWVDRAGKATVESRAICELLLAEGDAERLTPSPLEGPIWAYADFCDGPLEDLMFRIASPQIRDSWSDPGERALYTLIKERKFGAGCIDQWQRDKASLLARARHLLAPSLRTLERVPFLFGDAPTLADAALYGNLACIQGGDASFVREVAPALDPYMARLEAVAHQRAPR